jgi:hypothetical protein
MMKGRAPKSSALIRSMALTAGAAPADVAIESSPAAAVSDMTQTKTDKIVAIRDRRVFIFVFPL